MADKKVEAKKADAKKADAKKPAKKNKQNVFQKLFKYLSACKGELKKITWPSPKQTTKNFGIVIGVIVVVGLFIFGLDRGLFALLGLVMNTSAYSLLLLTYERKKVNGRSRSKMVCSAYLFRLRK